MAVISYIDDNFKLSYSYIQRNYDNVKQEIEKNREELTYSLQDGDKIFAYHITKNEPLTKLYEKDFYVVKFVFENIETLHEEQQEKKLLELAGQLKQHMEDVRGYYNLRVPTHVVDLIKAINSVFDGLMMCGGTVEEVTFGKKVESNINPDLKISFVEQDYIVKHKEVLLKMTYDSFKSYQGQYHISPITAEKAGRIYENWIEGSLDHFTPNTVVVAEYESEPVGFVTICEKEEAVEGILSAVDSSRRKLGAYKSMIAYLINYACERKKNFISSTQFDNFIVQGAWNSLGMKPFYSIYNMHIDTSR